ncbi:DUF6895 family protein [Actinophytocola glycyrrhizae]|uniref:DUF6895 family protein n=1 Tax=Actinophytocola glycyrrhizae TaxID=2044873 RepID=A0ABV9SBY0_9PSEU
MITGDHACPDVDRRRDARFDWGRHPDHLPAELADYLSLWLPVWIDEWATHRHWDLLGELLVVDACLPEPALDDAVWRYFAAAQTQEGAMPVRSVGVQDLHRAVAGPALPPPRGEALRPRHPAVG